MATAAKTPDKDFLHMKTGCWKRTQLLDLLTFLFAYVICIPLARFSAAQPMVHAEKPTETFQGASLGLAPAEFCLWGNSKQQTVVRLASLCPIWGQKKMTNQELSDLFPPPRCEIQTLSDVLLNLGPQLTKNWSVPLDSHSASGAPSHHFFAHSYTGKDHQKHYHGETRKTRSSHSSTPLTDLGRFPRLWRTSAVGKCFQKSEADLKLLQVTVWLGQKRSFLGYNSPTTVAQGSSSQTRQPPCLTLSAKSSPQGWLVLYVHTALPLCILQQK